MNFINGGNIMGSSGQQLVNLETIISDLVIEWRFLGISNEKLIKIIIEKYEEGEKNEVNN